MKKAETILTVIKQPGKEPEFQALEAGEKLLTTLQRVVGGPIEALPLDEGGMFEMVFNEEGKLQRLMPNVMHGGDVIVGTIVIVKSIYSNWVDMDRSDADLAMNIARSLKSVTKKKFSKDPVLNDVIVALNNHVEKIGACTISIFPRGDGNISVFSCGDSEGKVNSLLAMVVCVAKDLAEQTAKEEKIPLKIAYKLSLLSILDGLKHVIDDDRITPSEIEEVTKKWLN